MPNSKGNYTKAEMMGTGASCFIPDAPGALTGRWRGPIPDSGIVLTRKRCADVGAPVREREYPVSFVYRMEIKSDFKFVPFYQRQADEIDRSKLNHLEERVLQNNEARKAGGTS